MSAVAELQFRPGAGEIEKQAIRSLANVVQTRPDIQDSYSFVREQLGNERLAYMRRKGFFPNGMEYNGGASTRSFIDRIALERLAKSNETSKFIEDLFDYERALFALGSAHVEYSHYWETNLFLRQDAALRDGKDQSSYALTIKRMVESERTEAEGKKGSGGMDGEGNTTMTFRRH